MTYEVAHRRDALIPGEPCGDWVGAHTGLYDRTPVLWLAVVDGLGHGAPAAHAAHRAAEHLLQAWQDPQLPPDPVALLQTLSRPLRDTRGAAVALACLHRTTLHHAGVGNTRCILWQSGRQRRLPSSYGIVGEPDGAVPVEQRLAVATGDWVVMFTDGLQEALRLDLLGLSRPPTAERLCDQLMAQWRNPLDDAAVLAACWEP